MFDMTKKKKKMKVNGNKAICHNLMKVNGKKPTCHNLMKFHFANLNIYVNPNSSYYLKTLRAFPFRNFILSYLTILKNYFINYIILFYNTPNIITFIFLYNTLK